MKTKKNSSTASDTPKKSRKSLRISRRDLLKQGLLTAASLPLLGGTVWAGQQNPPEQAQAANPQAPACSSVVFSDKCKDGNQYKCVNYDYLDMYPLLAFWLMLATEDWDKCLSNAAWRAKLAQELGAKNLGYAKYADAIEDLYKQVYAGNPTLSAGMAGLRTIWQNFIGKHLHTPPPNYGARPCPGGKTLLELAYLGSTHP